VAALVWVGVLGASLPWMIFAMAAGALVAWLALRRLVGVRGGQKKVWDRDINDN
jgi:hypothetical protein